MVCMTYEIYCIKNLIREGSIDWLIHKCGQWSVVFLGKGDCRVTSVNSNAILECFKPKKIGGDMQLPLSFHASWMLETLEAFTLSFNLYTLA